MAKKEKAKKPEEPEADKPAAEGEEGAPVKKKMAGKTLILFIVLPAVLVLGGGGAGHGMVLGRFQFVRLFPVRSMFQARLDNPVSPTRSSALSPAT